jgi:hypothetical protein
MGDRTFRSIHAVFLVLCSGCGFEMDEPPSVSMRQSPVVCNGQSDKLITTATVGYLGAREEVNRGPDYVGPESIGHSSAAELLWSQAAPSNEHFAVAWISNTQQNRTPWVRRYSTSTKNFLAAPQQLDTYSSPGWMQTLGFDDNCSGAVAGAQTCAWFTWEDTFPYINWRAIGNNGAMSALHYSFIGHAPSGDTGQVLLGWQIVRKKLLAWVSNDRTQVYAQLLDNNGWPMAGTQVVLYSAPVNFNAYQTATAWSSREQRWLVAWTVNDTRIPAVNNGIIYSRYVSFDGSPGPANNVIMYCEGLWNQPLCGAGAKANGAAPLANSRCSCKGLWLASSWYSNNPMDRYRIHQYSKHARLDTTGTRQAIASMCTTYCPITEAGFWYGSDHTPFQYLVPGSGNPMYYDRLVEDSFSSYREYGASPPPFFVPQAFRSDGSVAVAVATDSTPGFATGLKLSIIDVRQNGCPP